MSQACPSSPLQDQRQLPMGSEATLGTQRKVLGTRRARAVLLWVLGDGGMKGLIWNCGQLDPPCLPLPLCCPPCPPAVLATSTTCRGGQGAPQCSLLAPSPPLKRCFLPGCEGEERGGSTCPEATVMGTTTTLATDLKEGPHPSCAATHLVQGLPKGSWCYDPERIQPRSPVLPRPARSHIPQPRDVGGSRALGVPPAPTCLQLARRPRRQLTLEVRVSIMGPPNPARPGSDRHGGCRTGAMASPTQAHMHSAGRVGDMQLRRAFRSLV